MRVATRPILPVTKNGRPATRNRFLRPTLFRAVSFSVFLTTGAALLSGGTITIDFEGQGDGTLLTNQYSGLLFSNTIVLSAGLSLNEDEFPPYSGVNVVLDDGGPISISFSSPVISAGGFFTHSQSIQLDAFDAVNNLVASSTSLSSNNEAISGDPGTMPNEWLTVDFGSGFSNLTITGADIGDSFTLDNFTYKTPSVATPEPSAFFLGILGFGAILILRFRGSVSNELRGYAPFLCLIVFVVIPISLSGQVPAVGIPGSDPAAVNVGISTKVTVTTRINAANVIAGSANVQLLNAQGQAQAVIGFLHDDGVSPDLFAGDGVYSGSVSVNANQTGPLNIRVSVATKGSPLRTVSGPLALDVLPAGIPVTSAFSDFSQTTIDPATGNRIIANEVLVCFTPATDPSDIISDASLIGGTIIGRYSGLGNCYQLGLPSGSDGAAVDSAIGKLKSHPEVVSASANTVLNTAAASYPAYCKACGTVAFNVLRLGDAQFVTATNSTIAILDTGVDENYKNENPNVTLGPDVTGSLGTSLGDMSGHGTGVAGVIGATAPAQRIYVIRAAQRDPISGSFGSTESTLSQAIKKAVDAGADVVNISIAGPPSSSMDSNTALGMAIEYASDRNVLLVAAAGNGTTNRCPDPTSSYTTALYPAAFASSFHNILSVAATVGGTGAGSDVLWPCSTVGPWINIAAPGVDIQTNGLPPTLTALNSGTSLAAPWVAGSAALIKAVNRSWTPTQIIALFQQTGTIFGQAFKRVNPVQQVNVQVTGLGTVTISSSDGLNSPDGMQPNDGSVACTSTTTCNQWFLGTTTVRLTASGAVSWGGDCSSGMGATVTLILSGDQNCTADFTMAHPPRGECSYITTLNFSDPNNPNGGIDSELVYVHQNEPLNGGATFSELWLFNNNGAVYGAATFAPGATQSPSPNGPQCVAPGVCPVSGYWANEIWPTVTISRLLLNRIFVARAGSCFPD